MNIERLKKILKGITLKKIHNYFDAQKRKRRLRKYNKNNPNNTKEYWELEQIEWRLKGIKNNSPICFQNKECIVCGCDVNFEGGLEYGKEACEANCFPEWMDKETWLKFKDASF